VRTVILQQLRRGKRTTKEKITQLEALTKEGLTVKEIAQKLGRTPTAKRNLRHEKKLVIKAKGEISY
jgi:IS30 family transposase